MAPPVAIPRIFLRGNRWYVRVQVPAAMKADLGRIEYWVSLRTSDRSLALQRAAGATRNKRHEIEQDYLARREAADGPPGHATDDQFDPWLEAVPDEPNILDTLNPKTAEAERVVEPETARPGRPAKARSYQGLSKQQLIELLEQNDRTQKLGLVWERDWSGTGIAAGGDFITARIDTDLSDGPALWVNLVIEGDNYDALRWLRRTHRGRIKCIYIDPPYNTGNSGWVYHDRYHSAEDRYRQSAWLEFLHCRLVIAQDLLTTDGVILMSINDEQRALAELMMRDALPGMQFSSLVWRTRNGSNADQDSFLSPDHEHIIVASKTAFSFAGVNRTYETYSNPDHDVRGDWQAVPMRLGFSKDERPNLYYPLYDPATGTHYPCNPDAVWRFATRSNLSEGQRLQTQPVEDFVAQGRIIFPSNQRVETFATLDDLEAAIDLKDVPLSLGVPMLRRSLPDLSFWVGKKIGYGTPTRKLFKSELRRSTKPLSSWISGASEPRSANDDSHQIVAGSYTEGSHEIRRIFGSKAFNYAKPVSLIRELIRQATSSGDLVLDFFAGSATTAQAVMELNAKDHGDRRFIMVSSTEASNDDPHKNLCRDVTAERIRLLTQSTDRKYAKLSAGFAYLRTHSVGHATFDYDLASADVWTCVEAFHGLPLTPYDNTKPWNVHESGDTVVVLVDRFETALVEWVRSRSEKDVYLYAWATGPFAKELGEMNIQIALVGETLMRAFRL